MHRDCIEIAAIVEDLGERVSDQTLVNDDKDSSSETLLGRTCAPGWEFGFGGWSPLFRQNQSYAHETSGAPVRSCTAGSCALPCNYKLPRGPAFLLSVPTLGCI